MSLIRVFEDETFVIDYDKDNKRYRVSYFVNNHWVDECWFDAYEDMPEISLSEAVKKYELMQCQITDKQFKTMMDMLKAYIGGTDDK